MLPFPEEEPKKPKKTKILESWRRRGLKSPKSLFFFGFFGTPPGKCKLLVENVAISWGSTKKTQKTKDFKVLAKARPEESKIFVFFFVFLVPLQENASFWWKTLPFPEEVPKKPKILESWRRRGLKSPKSLVFWFFCTPPGKCKLLVENVAISWGGTKKTQKTKDFRVLAKARPEESIFFGFFGTPPGKCKLLVENVAISWGGTKKPKKPKILKSWRRRGLKSPKSLVFWFFCTPPGKCKLLVENVAISWGGTKKNKKTKDFRVLAKARPEESKIFVFFVFLGTSPGKCKLLVENVAISWGGTTKTKKNKDFRVLAKARPEESKIFVFFFLFFWYPSRKMQAFGGKRCHFLRRYQKNPKKPKILKWRVQNLCFFLVFLVPLQENASFWWKTLPFPEEVPKKPKKPKILESWRRRGLKSPKSLVFWFFWYPSRKMQAFGGKRCHFLRRYKIKQKHQVQLASRNTSSDLIKTQLTPLVSRSRIPVSSSRIWQ